MEGLTLRQVRFAHLVAESEVLGAQGDKASATSLAIRAGYSDASAAESAGDNLRNSKVQEAIQKRRDELAAAAGLTPEWILREWMLIAAADPSDLVSVVVKCCEMCWAFAMPDLPPNPECKTCQGIGVSFVRVADVKKLKGPARKLFAGAKQTKDGIEIKMRNQDEALSRLADYLGMQNKSAAAVAVAVAGVKTDERKTAREYTEEELQAIVDAGMATLGVPQGVSSASALPSGTIEGTFETV